MENKYLIKFKDPLFRKEVYEYLRLKVYDRLAKLQLIPVEPISIYHSGYTGYICINLHLKYNGCPEYQWCNGQNLGDPFNLNMMLPELQRPADCNADKTAWFDDDVDGNLQRLECLNNALELVKQKINEN